MKIYETRAAPNPRRLRMFLAEKGLTLDVVEVDLMAGDLESPEFAALNPLKRVPVLVLDDGTAIAESLAICRYFEVLHPEPALFGQSALEQAQVEMWNRRMELNLLFHVAQVLRHLNPKMAHLEQPQVPAWGEANKPKVVDMLRLLDKRLSGSPFIAGDRLSVADITAFVAIGLMKPARLERPPDLTHLDRWHAEMAARPSAAA